MNQNQRIDTALGNEPGRDNRLAKRSGGRQNARVIREQRLGGRLLIGPQCAMKSNFQRRAKAALIAKNRLDF